MVWGRGVKKGRNPTTTAEKETNNALLGPALLLRVAQLVGSRAAEAPALHLLRALRRRGRRAVERQQPGRVARGGGEREGPGADAVAVVLLDGRVWVEE